MTVTTKNNLSLFSGHFISLPLLELAGANTHTLTHYLSLSLTHKHTYTHSLTHPAYVSLSHTLYLSLTHTLTLVLFLSFDVRNVKVSDSSTLNLIDYNVIPKVLSVLYFAHSAAVPQWLWYG